MSQIQSSLLRTEAEHSSLTVVAFDNHQLVWGPRTSPQFSHHEGMPSLISPFWGCQCASMIEFIDHRTLVISVHWFCQTLTHLLSSFGSVFRRASRAYPFSTLESSSPSSRFICCSISAAWPSAPTTSPRSDRLSSFATDGAHIHNDDRHWAFVE